MSLGEAYIDIKARTGLFTAQLKALATEIDALQAKANSALSGVSTRSGTTGSGAAPAVAAQESIAAASKAAADSQIADVRRVAAEAARSQAKETADAAAGARERAQIAAREAGEVVAESDAAYRAAKENYEKTAAAAEAASARSIEAQKRLFKAEEAQRAKQTAIERNSDKLRTAREDIPRLSLAAGERPSTAAERAAAADFRKALAAEEQAIRASGRLGDAEAKTYAVLERARLAAEKAAEKSSEADTKAYRALVARDAEIERSNAALSNQSRLLYELTKVETAATAADEALTKAREQQVFATDAAGQADLRLAQAERSVAAAAEASARIVVEGAAQEATALRALGAVAEEAAAKIARVNAAGIAAPATAPTAARAVAEDGGVKSTVATEKANIAASQSAIAAINKEKAARRAQLAEAIAAGDETVKALRAEIVEEGKLANAAVSAEKLSIAASRARIAIINEETLALKARNGAAGEVGPARAVSPIAALNNAAVKQELADTALAAKEAEKAIEAARKASEVPFSPGSPSGIANFHALTLAAKEAQKAIEEAAKNAPQFSPGSASGIAEFQAISDAAKKSAADQLRYNEEVLASARETAREIATAETAAYAEVSSRAKAAAAAQVAANKTVSESFIGKTAKDIPGDLFGAITKSAKFASIGVLGLGAALTGIGLVNAAKQQAAVVGFTALAGQITATTDAVTGLNVATQGLTDVQAKGIGQDFENQLITLSNNSALAQSALQDTTQALLSLGYSGPQALSTVRDIGNALAASGKTGGGLNDDLKGIVVAFSQISGAGRLLAQDLNQITTRIPSASRVVVYRQIGLALKEAGVQAKGANKFLAGVNAKEGTAAFNEFLIGLQKVTKEGRISSQIAIPAILKALQQVPGAAATAANGFQDALARGNLTLTGRFEALKDNIRSALAAAFLLPGDPGGTGKSLSDRLADQLGKLIPKITDAIKAIGPPLSKFVEQFTGFLGAALPPLVTLIGKVFGAIGDGLAKIDLTGLTDGFHQLGTDGTAAHDALKNFQTVALEVYQIAKALLPVVLAIVKAFVVLAAALAPLEPAIKAIADLLGKAFSSKLGQDILVVGTSLLIANKALKETVALITAVKKLEELALLVRGFKALAGAEDLATASAVRLAAAEETAVGAGLLGKIAKARKALALLAAPEVVIPVAVGAVVGAGVAQALNKFATPKGFADKDELSVEKFNQGLKDLQARIDSVTDAKAKRALQDLTKTTLSTHDAQDRFKGALDAAQKVIDNYDASHVVGANNKLTKSLNDVHFAAVISKDAVANLIRVGTITAGTAGIDNIDAQLRQLTLDGNAAAEAIFRAERQAAGLSSNPSLNQADAQGEANSDAAKGRAAQAAADLASKPKPAKRVPTPTPVDLTAFNDAANSAGNAAQSAAKTLADKIKTAKQTLTDSLTAFRQDITTQTPKQIRSALNTIRKEFDKLGKLEGVNTSGLDKKLAKDSTALQNFSKELAKTTKDLAAAQARFTEVSDSIKTFASVSSIDLESIGLAATSAKTKLADLSRLRIVLPGENTLNVITGGAAADLAAGAKRFSDALADKLKQAQEFTANIKKLIAEGLNKTTIDQIISAGPEGGGTLAQSLAGASKQTIDAINATQKGIDDAAKELGNTAADSLFRAGTQVVSGLIQGLKDQSGQIKAAMKDIALALVEEIKKALKIHSPSRRMASEVGAHIVPGLLAPIHAQGHGLVRDAMSSIADTMAAHAPTLAPVNLDTLSSLADAEASLNLKAALAPSSVQLLAPPPTPQRMTLGADGVQELASAISTARAIKEINAPVTQHFHGSNADPHAAAKALAKAVGGLR